MIVALSVAVTRAAAADVARVNAEILRLSRQYSNVLSLGRGW